MYFQRRATGQFKRCVQNIRHRFEEKKVMLLSIEHKEDCKTLTVLFNH